ncbi:hypothetical protein [Albimonas pacifica]|uniref:Transcriptional regulatory protein, C terminal n=1 Tax=Albimonas pacifica TaxID=1114924 RepID=A0A1I3BDN9_9RHOB|nr:hypothetical protein [Albimonas pacifica]SFH60413.1 Transcriptional regulatory protein, C terminal [Albimonas pacifica]
MHGGFSARLSTGERLSLGSKQKALLAVLALAPDGARARAWLQAALWSRSDAPQAQSSLRTAISDLRRALGPAAGVLSASRSDVSLDLERVRVVDDPGDGELLAGIDLPDADGFEDWLRQARQGRRRRPVPPPARPWSAEVVVLPLLSAGYAAAPSPLGDLVSEDVARRLGRTGVLDVVSHLSAREFVRQGSGLPLASSLGAAFVVCGRVLQTSPRIDCEIDLHDIAAGRFVWSRRFLCAADEPFERPDSISAGIAQAVFATLAGRAVEQARALPLEQLSGRELTVAAIRLMHRSAPGEFLEAGRLLSHALGRDPRQAATHAWLGKWHVMRVQRSLSEAPRQDQDAALRHAARALDADPDATLAHAVTGFVHSHLMRDFTAAETHFSAARAIVPSDAFSTLLLGAVRAFQDRPAEAIELTERARSLSPLDPERYHYDSLGATAYLCGRRFQEALDLAQTSLKANRNHPSTRRVEIIALQMLDRGDEARSAARALMELEPGLTIDRYLARHPAAESASGQEFARALAAAGVPQSA